jgi:hypothetical protein
MKDRIEQVKRKSGTRRCFRDIAMFVCGFGMSDELERAVDRSKMIMDRMEKQ